MREPQAINDWHLLKAYGQWFKKAATTVGCGWLFLYPILVLLLAFFVPLSVIDSSLFIVRRWYWGICGKYRGRYIHTAGSVAALVLLFILLTTLSLLLMAMLKSEDSDWWWTAIFVILFWFPFSAALTQFIVWRSPSQKEIGLLNVAHYRVAARITKAEAQLAKIRDVRDGEPQLLKVVHDNLEKLEAERHQLEKEKGDIADAIRQRSTTRIRLDAGWGMLSAIVFFLIFISAAFADILYNIEWLPIFSQKMVAGLTEFTVSARDGYLEASFRLVDVENEPLAVRGKAHIQLYEGRGSLIYDEWLDFSKKGFNKQLQEYNWTIPKGRLSPMISTKDFIAKAVSDSKAAFANGRAVLEVNTNNGEITLTAEYSPVKLYSAEEVEKIIKETYYEGRISNLQAEFNKQWPFKVQVVDYIMLGNYGWVVVKRTGEEIIISNPLSPIYDWYILHSKSGGKSWDILWRGDRSPLFKVEFLSETQVRLTTLNAVFNTTDEGKTWKSSP